MLETELRDAMKCAKEKNRREPLVAALADDSRRQRMAELVKYSGTSDTLLSNAAIEALDEERSRNRTGTPRRHRRRP